MPFDSESAKAAANKRWAKTKAEDNEELKMKDYGLPAKATDEPTLGAELPVTRNVLAGGIAEWPDLVYDLDPNAYHLIRRCPAIFSPVKKLAVRTAKLDWVVIGEGQAEDVQTILDASQHLSAAIEWLMWGLVEGVRFMYMDPYEDPETKFITGNFTNGGRKKINAGGNVAWDGTRLVTERKTTGVDQTETEELNIKEWIIFRPGAGSNPQGDPELGLIAYDIAKDYLEARKNQAAYMELHGIPTRVIKKKLDRVRSTQVQGILGDAAERYAKIKNNQALALQQDDAVELLEPKGKGFLDMIEFNRYLAAEFQMAILGNTLTSDTASSGPAGSSEIHLSEEDEYVYFYALQIAEALNMHYLPWLGNQNNIDVSSLKIVPMPQGQRDGVEDEGDKTDDLQTDQAGDIDTPGEVDVDPVEEAINNIQTEESADDTFSTE